MTDCPTCQDRGVVGGFLPAPCPECRAADANPHIADLCHELVIVRRERNALRALVTKIDETLRVPAAEYVPAISDVFALIDEHRKDGAK